MRAVLEALTGQTISTLTGRPNTILRVEVADVVVATGKSPMGKRVPIKWLQQAADRLYREGAIEISVPSVGYRSAFVGAVLATLPGTVATIRPRWIRLRANPPTGDR